MILYTPLHSPYMIPLYDPPRYFLVRTTTRYFGRFLPIFHCFLSIFLAPFQPLFNRLGVMVCRCNRHVDNFFVYAFLPLCLLRFLPIFPHYCPISPCLAPVLYVDNFFPCFALAKPVSCTCASWVRSRNQTTNQKEGDRCQPKPNTPNTSA